LEQPWRRWKDIIAALLPKPKMPEFVTEALNDQCKAVLDQIPCQAISTTLPQMPPMPVMLSHLRDHCEQLWDQGKLELKQLQEVGAAVAREAKQLESMGLEGIVSAVGPEKPRVVVQLASAQSAVLTSHLRDIVKAKMHTGLISKARAVIEALEQPGPPQVQELDEVFEEIQAAPMIERIAATKTIADSVSNWLEQAVQILGRVADAPEVEKEVQSPVIKALLAFKDSVSTAVESKGTATADTITNATTTSKPHLERGSRSQRGSRTNSTSCPAWQPQVQRHSLRRLLVDSRSYAPPMKPWLRSTLTCPWLAAFCARSRLRYDLRWQHFLCTKSAARMWL